MNYGDEE
jgi:hypothetical protein